MNLTTKVAALHRVGKTLEKRLKHIGIETAEDLLFYFPFRYEDYSEIVNISQLQEGQEVTVRGVIELIGSKRSPRKRTVITEAIIFDGQERLRVVWFGQPFIAKQLKVGDTVYLSGKVKSDMWGMQMVSPAFEKERRVVETTPSGQGPDTPPQMRRGPSSPATTHTARIVPMYSLTAGMTQKQLRFLVSQIVGFAKDIPEWLPDDIRDQADVMPLAEAIRAIHFPESQDELKHAERRLKFDELFVLQLRAEMIRQSIKRSVAPAIAFKEEETKAFVASLPFELTKDQKVAAWDILKDLEKPEPMNRLLEGDVGSGKTVVSALVMNNVVLNAYQSVMMAPTEILATQHFETITKLLPELRVGLLTHSKYFISNIEFESKSKTKQKEEMYQHIQEGKVDILIGTHALLSEGVMFQKLGLVIIDEQHRFGVEQRKVIREKSGIEETPHFLSMTATPIPRSFALTIYGDLDLSIIKQMPSGRKPIKTRLVAPHNREKAYAFIREQIQQGRQTFVICPLIQTTDNGQQTTESEKKTVMDEYKKLQEKIFPDLRVDFLHGKLKSEEKDATMEKFSKGETDILVSTSVVEVGVDIPNASVMMIEGAERFGLAQLHQFRGRVGRSDHQSYCFLFTDSDSQKVSERLTYFEKTTDGFALAEYDLSARGPGDVYGKAQSGMGQLRLATMKDSAIIKLARDVARGIDFKKYPSLKKRVKHWEETVHLE